MALNTFLVLGVVPANNEQEVPINASIKISFAKHMDANTLTESNIKMRKVNGEYIPYTFSYSYETYQLILKPSTPLAGSTQYQVEVIGGKDGVKSVTGDYTNTRTYEFTTILTKSISQPRNLFLTQDNNGIKVSWETPSVINELESVSYDVRVSSSNDPVNPHLWPELPIGTEYNQTETSLIVQKEFETERNYYVMVRAVSVSDTSDWTISQIYLEKPVVTVTPTTPSTPGTGGGVTVPAPMIEQVEVLETYPAPGAIIQDGRILIVFSDLLNVLPVIEPPTEEPVEDLIPAAPDGSETDEDTLPDDSEDAENTEGTDTTEDTTENADTNEDTENNEDTDVDVIPDIDVNVDPVVTNPLNNLNLIYVVQAPYKERLTMIDLLTAYAPSKAIPGNVSILDGQVLEWQATEDLEPEKDYVAIVSKDIKGTNTSKMGVPYILGFRSPWDRLYGNVNTIKSRLGDIADTISDATIYETMHVNTLFAYETVSETSSYSATDYTDKEAPYFVHQYVNLQTAYDVLLNDITRSGGSNKEDFTLGQLQVSKEGDSTSRISLLKSLKSEIKPWLDMIHGHHNRGYAKPVGAVKGETGSAYPDFLTRSELKTEFDV